MRDLRRARTDVQGDRQRARRRLGKLGLRHGWSYQEGWTVGLERWLNLVEAFFSIITRQALRRGNHPTVADLVAATESFIHAWNDRCRPFTWTKDPDTVIAKATDPRRRKASTRSDTEH